ncbi:hypothetical protein GCM10009745_80230 [Kribbella yunnanensis]|uniref:DUF748 domain-containing protein n=1 Tax=Kribbella yunnanensis TaxID=190194 RepID=A0ABN2J708_9ACTN
MEFLVATVLAVAGVAVAGVTLLWQKRGTGFKRVHYTAACDQLLLDRDDEAVDSFLSGPISVHLEPSGTKLVWPMAFKLRLANTGMAPIQPSDFSSTLNIDFGPRCELLGGSITVSRGRADEFLGSESAVLDHGCLKLTPFLLNPRDEITISGMLNGVLPEDGIAVSGRVTGMETFVRLRARERGPRAELVVNSLLHDSLEHQPIAPDVDVKIFVLPKFLPFEDLGSAPRGGRGISTRLNGSVVERMHQVSFQVTNRGRREVDLTHWLRCHTGDRTFLHLLDIRKAHVTIASDSQSDCVDWNSRAVGIRPGPLGVGETFSATFIAEGRLDEVEVGECPDEIEDVQIARMTFPDTSLERHLAEMSPRVILTSPGIYRGLQKLRDALRVSSR